jgi:hypothetical protein
MGLEYTPNEFLLLIGLGLRLNWVTRLPALRVRSMVLDGCSY